MNRQTLKTEKLLSSSPSTENRLVLERLSPCVVSNIKIKMDYISSILVNLFLMKLVRISGFSSLFLAIAVFSAHFARDC